MKHYMEDNKLVFKTDKGKYIVIYTAELTGFQDFAVNEYGVDTMALNEPSDFNDSGYGQYYIYEASKYGDFDSEYIGEPFGGFNIEHIEEQIKEYENGR